jgi:hypothetical protein
MAINPESLLIFRAREEEEAAEEEKKKQTNKPTVLNAHPQDKGTEQAGNANEAQGQSGPVQEIPKANRGFFGSKAKTTWENPPTLPPEEFSKPKIPKKPKQEDSRAAAKGRKCVWHPWREAYAICSLCNRPFCFQDMIELNKEYYCLEDMDKVPMLTEDVRIYQNYNLTLISGILLMLSFLTFFYFSNSQVLYIVSYLHRVGLPFFLTQINYSYAIALIESLVMVICLVAGVSLFVRSKKGYYLSLFMCLVTVVLFSYQYTNTTTLYLGVIAAICFVSFISLLFSNTTYSETSEKSKTPTHAIANEQIIWPNVGKF